MSHPIGVSPTRETPFHRKKKVVGWGLKAVAVVALAIVLAGCPDDDDAPLISSTDDEEVSGDEGAPDETSAGDEAPTDSADQETNDETGNEETDTRSESADDDPPPDETLTTGELEIVEISGFTHDGGFIVEAVFSQLIFDQSVYFVTVEIRVQTPEANISTLYSRTEGSIDVDSTNLDTGDLFPLNTSASTSSTTFTMEGCWPPDFALAPGEHQYTLTAEYQQTEGGEILSVESGEQSFQEDP